MSKEYTFSSNLIGGGKLPEGMALEIKGVRFKTKIFTLQQLEAIEMAKQQILSEVREKETMFV